LFSEPLRRPLQSDHRQVLPPADVTNVQHELSSPRDSGSESYGLFERIHPMGSQSCTSQG
jgi:hypothetical protein